MKYFQFLKKNKQEVKDYDFRIRAHHLFNLRTYSKCKSKYLNTMMLDFWDNTLLVVEIYERILNNEETKVKIVTGNDDLCGLCKAWYNFICSEEDTHGDIAYLDYYNLKEGNTYTSEELMSIIEEKPNKRFIYDPETEEVEEIFLS